MAKKLTRRQRAKRDPNNGDAGRKRRKDEKRALLRADPAAVAAVCATMPAGQWFKRHGLLLMGTGPVLAGAAPWQQYVTIVSTPESSLTLGAIERAKAFLEKNAVQPDANGKIWIDAVSGEFIP